ncbi:Serine/threonine-protein kinase ATM [Apostasia shenzhenica]|uniref:Serine/threonine-protein kinase ATM n=1 Tax=Apostasia shenzhenica TaxID=1088818 RepID=A0A2I0AJ36_9ASPA|nr:Serine/threonine-protein kinase ATM [Apostasia shenzhenica]
MLPRRGVSNESQIMDFVWGKLNEKLWWPGQICDPSEAPEQALITQHLDHCVLVSYFGEHSFAWCYPSQLKPFGEDFSKMVKQMGSESLVSAVNDALCEMERCLRADMTCSCVPVDGRVEVMFRRTAARRKASMAGCRSMELLKLLRDVGRDVLVADKHEVTLLRSFVGSFYLQNGSFIERIQDLVDEERSDVSTLPGKRMKVKSDKKYRLPANRKIKQTEILVGESSRKKRSMAELIGETDLENRVVMKKKSSEVKIEGFSSTRRRKKENVNGKFPMGDMLEVDPHEESELFGKRERKKSKYLSPPYTSGYLKRSNSFELVDSEFEMVDSDGSKSESEIFDRSRTPICDIFNDFLFVAVNPLHQGRGHRTEEMIEFFGRHRSLHYSGIFDSEGLMEQAGESAGNHTGEIASCVRRNVRQARKGRANGEAGMKSGLYGVDESMNKVDNEMFEIPNDIIINIPGETRAPLKKKKRDYSVDIDHTIHSSSRTNEPKTKRRKQQDSVTLILTFSQARNLPSKDELISKFSMYGSLDELETVLLQDQACARLVFQRALDAKKALNGIKRGKKLEFPFLDLKSCYLKEDTSIVSKSEPSPGNSLVYLSENLQRMISSLLPEKKGLKSADGLKPEVLEDLVDDMKVLLCKVNGLISLQT